MAFLPRIRQQTPAWHKARKTRIGASEASALFRIDLPGYAMSAYTLRLVKRGVIPAESVFAGDPEQAQMGLAMEPIIAQQIAFKRGWKIKPGGYAYDDQEPRMGASLDFIIDHDPRPGDITDLMHVFNGKTINEDGELIAPEDYFTGRGVFQIKNIIRFQYERAWPGNTVPEYIRIQLQQELAVTGFKWGFIGVLVNGTELRTFPIVADRAFGDKLRMRIGEFWRDCIDGDKIPPIDGSESSRLALRALVEPQEFKRTFTDMRTDLELNQWAEDYHIAQLRKKADEALIDLRRNQIVERLGQYADVRSANFAVKYSVTDKQRRLIVVPVMKDEAPKKGKSKL